MNKKFNSILILLTIFHTLALPTDNGNNSFLGAGLFITTIAATIGANHFKKNQLKINNKSLDEKTKDEIKTNSTNNIKNLIESNQKILSRSTSNSSIKSTNSFTTSAPLNNQNSNYSVTPSTFELSGDKNLTSNLFNHINSTNEIKNSDEEKNNQNSINTIDLTKTNIEATINTNQKHSVNKLSSPNQTPSSITTSMPPETKQSLENLAFEAITNNNLDELKNLLKDNNFDVNLIQNGQTLLHHAVKNKSLKVVEFLLEKNADCNASNTAGQTPLSIACEECYNEISTLISLHITKRYKN